VARLLADENFPGPVVMRLRTLGHEVETVQRIGQGGRGWSDTEILEYAWNHGFAVLTLDRDDYLALDRRGVPHSGIVACTFNSNWDEFGRCIHEALEKHPDLTGLVVRVYQPHR
jgi:predicted nuclease of predicted toxin-antitoxin system